MLTLYYKESCPFCQRVMQVAGNLNIEFELRDVSEDATAAAELLEKGGKSTVPFLVDTERDVSMYESSDIIDYIREHYTNKDATVTPKPRVHMSDAVCVSCEG